MDRKADHLPLYIAEFYLHTISIVITLPLRIIYNWRTRWQQYGIHITNNQ